MVNEVYASEETVALAKQKACSMLGAEEKDVEFEVVQQPSKKLLGVFGGKLAQVKATLKESVASKAVKILKEILLSSGSVNMSLISPREVFLEALRNDAVNVILIHNHPSGDPSPSEADIQSTKRVFDMGHLLDVLLLDHIIIGDNCYFSFREYGFI